MSKAKYKPGLNWHPVNELHFSADRIEYTIPGTIDFIEEQKTLEENLNLVLNQSFSAEDKKRALSGYMSGSYKLSHIAKRVDRVDSYEVIKMRINMLEKLHYPVFWGDSNRIHKGASTRFHGNSILMDSFAELACVNRKMRKRPWSGVLSIVVGEEAYDEALTLIKKMSIASKLKIGIEKLSEHGCWFKIKEDMIKICMNFTISKIFLRKCPN